MKIINWRKNNIIYLYKFCCCRITSVKMSKPRENSSTSQSKTANYANVNYTFFLPNFTSFTIYFFPYLQVGENFCKLRFTISKF